jgi:hypothetical protein
MKHFLLLTTSIFLTLNQDLVQSYGKGAPKEACNQLFPSGHGVSGKRVRG